MPYSRPQLFELSKKVGRSWRTLQYWAAQGCNLNDPESVKAFLEAKELRKTNVQKARERGKNRQEDGRRSAGPSVPTGNGEVPAPGRTGAAAALERLEAAEESAHRRLEAALASGDRLRIQDAQAIRLLEVLLHAGTAIGGWSSGQLHAAVRDRFSLTAGLYPLNSLRYDLRKLRGHGLVEREQGRYAWRLTEKGQRVAILFLLFHQRLCGPIAGSQFQHRPDERHRPGSSKLETAYHQADRAIEEIVEILRAA